MKTCYYELLGVAIQADNDEIKRAYRKKALQWHPDKNPSAEAQKVFQMIQEAYEVLSDPQERAWYDGHRVQILSGGDTDTAEGDGVVDVWAFFSRQCFEQYDDAPDGFFVVYRNLFERINAEEMKWSEGTPRRRAGFGHSKSEWVNEVAPFYRDWEDFQPQCRCAFAAKWKLSDAPNREIRRLMEAENKKLIKEARKKYSEEIKKLVDYVRRRDPRVQARQREVLREAVKRQEEEEQKRQLQLEANRIAREQARLNELKRQEEFRRYREQLKAQGQEFEESSEAESNADKDTYKCDICRKVFKSEQQREAHYKSKKHLQMARKTKRKADKSLKSRPGGGKLPVVNTDDLSASASEMSEAEPCEDKPDEAQAPADALHIKTTLSDSESSVPSNASGKLNGADLLQKAMMPPVNDNTSASQSEDDESSSDGASSDALTRLIKVPQKRADDYAEAEGVDTAVSSPLLSENEKQAKVTPPVLEKKKPRRRQKQASTSPEWKCLVCNEVFETRNRLFRHVEKEGHAAYKGDVIKSGQGRGGKGKKR